MSTLLKILVALGVDTKEYDSKMTEAQKKAQTFGKNIASVGKDLQNAGGVMTAAVTLPLLGAATAAVNFASDLEESTNKVNVVFGNSAGIITSFASNASTKLGMTQQAALESAGTFGNLFTTMGLGEQTSADMSTQLLQLAADLGSFNNLDPTEVLEKLRSGLVGEVEPLRSLSINLSQTAVTAKAMEMGLASSTEELTPAMIAQARFALILEQTKNAQGDYARTSDGLANSTRTMKAELIDAGAKIGTMLLPTALKLVNGIQKVVSWLNNLTPAGQKTVLIIAGIAAAIGPLLVVIGTLMTAIGGIVTFLSGPVAMAIGATISAALPVIAVIAAIILAVVLLHNAWKNNWGGIRDKTKKLVDAITGFWNNKLIPGVKKVIDWFKKLFNITDTASDSTTGYGETVAETEDSLNSYIDMQERLRASTQSVVDATEGAGDSLDKYTNKYKTLNDIDPSFASKILGALDDIAFKLAGGTAFQAITDKVISAFDAGKVTPAQAQGMLGELYLGEQALQVQMNNLTTWEAAQNIHENLGIPLEDAYNQVVAIKDKVDAIPKKVTMELNIYTTGVSPDLFANGYNPGTGTTVTPRATGGQMLAGNPYLVNENPITRPELFVPSTPGYMLTKQDALDAISGKGAKAGNTYILNAYTTQSPDVVQRGFGMMRTLAGA